MGIVPVNSHTAQPPTMLIMLPTHSQAHLGPHLQLHTLPPYTTHHSQHTCLPLQAWLLTNHSPSSEGQANSDPWTTAPQNTPCHFRPSQKEPNSTTAKFWFPPTA